MSTPTPPPPPRPPDTIGPPAGPDIRGPAAALTAGPGTGGAPPAGGWRRAVLVPFSAGHQPPLPTGRRVPIPIVPAHLRAPATTAPSGADGPRGTRRRVVLTATVAAVAVLAIAAAFVVRASSGPGPDDVVREFFAALSAHDPTRLLADPCQDNPLCGPDALRAGYQAPQDVTIGNDTGTSTDRNVAVTYTLGGRRFTDLVDLRSTRRGTFGGRDWFMTSWPGATLTLPDQTPAPITLAAAQLPTRQPQPRPATMWAPPGEYTLTRPATTLLLAVQQQVTVTSGPPITLNPGTTLAPGITETVERLVHDRIDACATKHSFSPTLDATARGWHSCPMTYLEQYAITDDPTWTVQRYPTLHLEPAADGAITVTTTNPGQAAIRYRWTTSVAEPRTWTDATDTIDLTVTGQVTAPNGTPEWQPA
ncbi:hypothetical protein GCM10022255_086900 [Dactylosporangium darangshiense]|uniref:Uncharacterized protein n=1 Tax=Dactylosporangium darangshiense TaxID=579108 RepID=A0ABP8DMY4_9ACTN